MFDSGLTQGLEHIFSRFITLSKCTLWPACLLRSPSLPRHLFNLTFTSLTANFPALAWRYRSIHIFSLNDSFPVMEELEEITRPSAFLWHKVLLNCFTGIIGLGVPESKWWKMSQKGGQETSKCHCCGRRAMGDPCSPLEKAKAAWLRYWLPSSAVELCNSLQNLSDPPPKPLSFMQLHSSVETGTTARSSRANWTGWSANWRDWNLHQVSAMLQNGFMFCLFWQLKIFSAISQESWKSSTVSWLRVPRLWTSFRELTLNL